MNTLVHGIRPNVVQFLHQLLQVLLVGLTLGMMRTVVPALAETEFGVPRGSFLLLGTFVIAFGVVKGVMNFVAGRLSERLGRRRVLMLGWVVALPIPGLVWFAPSWGWIVFATILLGVNQGLTWSMTQTSKLDLTRPDERGLTIGLNEFAGYAGVALAGLATAWLATVLGARTGLLVFGGGTVLVALGLTLAWVKDTLPWARQDAARHALTDDTPVPGTWEVFARVSWRDRRLMAVCQAGLVEKFVDALVWVMLPLYLYQRGLSLTAVGGVVGVYGLTWGGSQLFTGKLSDHVGRQWPNVLGMFICGGGVALMVLGEGVAWWSVSAAVTGLGMALLYPNLSAAVADVAPPAWRGSAIGIYRFWRDLGYGVGALGLGLAAQLGGDMAAAFWFVAVAMFASGALLAWWGEETHPGLRRVGP
ncbi:MAG: MFS transporter [Rhizobium sp.]|nr:MFS transporter [Rhizobium sp.]